MRICLRRREFIAGLGGAAVWPLAAGAQQPALPVIGLLGGVSAARYADRMAGFHRGLSETGYVEGRNVAIEYRWADDHYDRLPALAADLVSRRVAVIFAAGPDVGTQAATGSEPVRKTIGIVLVAAIAACVATSEAAAKMTATLRLTRSAARAGRRSK